ncbi:DoxX family protein [Hyalangium sp.]|uniref:DoxX family protein n=1 Tax=Hyalangium sp. TaxID=2028555 RepID=UPI002D29B2B3|nr:DoxX family protein [Hyalangium sp.]HYI00813.1 DoxX family protein [Hyalangium sp.]
MNALAPLGRLLFSALFIFSGVNHFIQVDTMTPYAQSVGLPAARLAILGSGALLVVCGICVLLGAITRLSAALIALFLVAAALTMHRFWGLGDPQAAQAQLGHFMTNISLAGGALLITYFGPGPYSLHARRGGEAPRPGYAFRLRHRAQE